MQCTWLVTCDHAFFDQLGRPCLIGIFDRLQVSAVPHVAHMSVLAAVEGKPGERVQIGLEIYQPNGKPMVQVPPRLVAAGTLGQFFQNFTFNGINLPERGTYEVRVLFNGDPVAATTIDVTVGSPA